MRLRLLLAYAGCFLRLAMASKVAGPWQLMMYYYTYKMHYDVYGDANPYAPCKREDGSMCNFDEFMEFARQKGKRLLPWPPGTVSGRLATHPDPKETAPWMYDNVDPKFYAVSLDPKAVYAKSNGKGEKYDATEKKSASQYPFPPQIEELRLYIDDLRRKVLTERGVEIQDDPRLKDAWGYFKTSVQGVADMRRRDTWTQDLERIKEEYTKKGVTPTTKDFVSSVDSNKKWTEIDIEAITAQFNGNKEQAMQPLKDFQGKETGAKHWPVIERIDMLNSYNKVPIGELCKN